MVEGASLQDGRTSGATTRGRGAASPGQGLAADRLGCVRGERELFRDVSFAVAPGELLRVRGPNGSGKTSLLRILCGLASPESGEVRWNGRPIGASRDEFHRDLAWVGHLPGAKDELTPVENLRTAAALADQTCDADDCIAALDAFGIADLADLPLRHLSAGQRRRVALARLALADAVPLWILDEPFTALDGAAVERLAALVGAHVSAGRIAVMTTHMEVGIPGVEVHAVDLGRRPAGA